MNERQQIISDFLGRVGWGQATCGPLAGDASFRRYFRLNRDGEKAVLMDAPPPRENIRPFLQIQKHLLSLGYSAPRSLAFDIHHGLLLLEDLGDDTFTRLLAAGVPEEELYQLATDFLADLHSHGSKAMPADLPEFDDARMLREVLLLLEWYYPEVAGMPATEALRNEFSEIWKNLFPLARLQPNSLVMFDFHVDNLLRLPGRSKVAACGLLDFQDAVAGPLTYDLMSLLEDARRDINPFLISRLRSSYLAKFPDINEDDFNTSWAVMAAQRHCRVIGVFTRLCRRDQKPGYLVHIPRCWRLLERALAHPALAELSRWLEQKILRTWDEKFPPTPIFQEGRSLLKQPPLI